MTVTHGMPPQTHNHPLVFLSAGEASGDAHGARLVHEIRQLAPTAAFVGVGGERLAAEGMQVLYPAAELAVVGLIEVAGKLPRVIQALRRVWAYLKAARPGLVILVDFPDFNFLVARMAKRLGLPVMYYISPQIWAWRRYRVHTLARLVDRMAVIFPFEAEFYRRYGVAATYVGHPLRETMPALPPPGELRRSLGLSADELAVALLPGSRESEIARMLPVMAAAAGIMAREIHGCRFLLPLAPSAPEDLVRRLAEAAAVPITVVHGRAYEVLAAAELAVVTSGTATLEAALLGTPMVIVYRLAPLSYALGRRLIQVPHIGMANLLAEERLFPELIQAAVTPEAIAVRMQEWLTHPESLDKLRRGLTRLIHRLGGPGASRRAAAIALELLPRV